MIVFEGESIPKLYTQILERIMEEGIEVGPRGMKTKELSPVTMISHDPRKRLFGHPHRRDVSIFTYVEGLWILLGEATPDRVSHYVKAMSNYVNEKSGVFDGAYGPRLRSVPYAEWPAWAGFLTVPKFSNRIDQLELVYERLKHDPDTRQAVVVINNPVWDWHQTKSKDIPCTMLFQFLLRKGKLNMVTYMRSQDAWLGLIYDTGEFQWFQEILAGWLDVDVGTYTHIDGSLHLYDRNWELAKKTIMHDANWDLYQTAKIMDCRLLKHNYMIQEKDLDHMEKACRMGKVPNQWDWVVGEGKNEFYGNLYDIIRAYNYWLQKDYVNAYEIVRNNNSDLGQIYKRRWVNDYIQGVSRRDSGTGC